jgi:hypothetical protein
VREEKSCQSVKKNYLKSDKKARGDKHELPMSPWGINSPPNKDYDCLVVGGN